MRRVGSHVVMTKISWDFDKSVIPGTISLGCQGGMYLKDMHGNGRYSTSRIESVGEISYSITFFSTIIDGKLVLPIL